MTCREKLMLEHPEMTGQVLGAGGVNACPGHYGYLATPIWCDYDSRYHTGGTRCSECWEREIPEFNSQSEFNEQPLTTEETQTLYHIPYPNLTVDVGCIIKDSGDRTQFESGAVRDMREGKGRCDLLPLEVVARLYGNHDGKTNMFEYIVRFQNTNETHHLVKALFKFGEEAYGKTERTAICTMLLEVAKHFEEGAKKYGESNWQKGIPVYCYIDSAVRHYLKWLRGDKDEPHDRAFVWNLMCCIWEVDYHDYGATEEAN